MPSSPRMVAGAAASVVRDDYDYRAYSSLCPVRGTRDIADRACRCSGLAITRLAGAQTTYARWDGWQIGVEAGWGNFRNDFGNSTSPLVAFILRNTTAEIRIRTVDLDSAVIEHHERARVRRVCRLQHAMGSTRPRVDLGYKYANIATGANDSISRQFTTSSQFQETVSIDARAQMKLVDYATLRARAGYAGASSSLMRC